MKRPFETTLIKVKNTQNIAVLPSIKCFSCIPVSLLAFITRNYEKIDNYSVYNYIFITLYLKEISQKCI